MSKAANPYLPTPEEIEEGCAAIRETWTEAEHRARWHGLTTGRYADNAAKIGTTERAKAIRRAKPTRTRPPVPKRLRRSRTRLDVRT